jgi:hypothetical protein
MDFVAGGAGMRGHGAAAQGLRDHAQHVLGVPVIFNALMAWDRVPLLPTTGRRLRTSTADTKGCAAMLMPLGGELFSIYIDERQGMFVQAQDCADSLHLLDGRWSGLRGVMPPDSACLAVAYRSRAGQLVLGVYDVLRVAGTDTSKLGVFERQKTLHDLFSKAPRAEAIERHWVGLEESLLRYVQQRQNLLSVPFDVSHMLRLEVLAEAAEAAEAAAPPQYQLVLRPVQVP